MMQIHIIEFKKQVLEAGSTILFWLFRSDGLCL